MQISIANPTFRPVTICLETQDELDMLLAVIEAVAENKINHTPPAIHAAQELAAAMSRIAHE